MTIFATFKSWRSALLAPLAVAVSGLMLVAAPAGAEAIDGVTMAAAAATESPAAVEQVETPVEQVETPTSDTVPAPVETQEVTSAAESAGTVVEDAVEDNPVAPASSGRTVSTPLTTGAVPSPRAVVDSVATVATEINVPPETGSDTTVVPAVAHQVSELVESVHRDSAETTESIRQGSAGTITPVIERLPAVRTGPEPLPFLLDSVAPTTIDTLLPASGPLQTAEEPSAVGPINFPEPRADLFSRSGSIASSESMRERLPLADFDRIEITADRSMDRGETRTPATTGGANVSLVGAIVDHSRSRGPAPLDVPPPAPESPGAIASGSGGSFFVPFAALLALLALVAPASLRRRREAADFRAPTPFACALERPG